MPVDELAEVLGVARGNVYAAIRAGLIPHIKISPRRIILPRVAIERWLETAAGKLPQRG